jgi:hypothetical protein
MKVRVSVTKRKFWGVSDAGAILIRKAGETGGQTGQASSGPGKVRTTSKQPPHASPVS